MVPYQISFIIQQQTVKLQFECKVLITHHFGSHLPQYHEELKELEVYADESQLDAIYQLRDKASRCSNLKQKLEDEDKALKRELMHLLCQKEMYGTIVRRIYQIGSNVDWEPEILRKIKPLIDHTKEQLMNRGKVVQGNEQRQRH